ncbi:MAG: helix-turn-helix domain-containing protein [Oligoflexus sp.]
MSTFKTIHYTLCGLEYVYIINAPIGIDEGEEYIDLPPEQIDRMIAAEIVRQGVPIRGREVLFLRKALKMNRNQWAEKLGVTASGILRWEQGNDKRLSKINEVAIRMLCAEELGVELEGKWSAVVTGNDLPVRLEVAA